MELNLSENIREMRKARGITLTELAQSPTWYCFPELQSILT